MSQPQLVRSLDGMVFSWSDSLITVSLTRLRESSRGTTAELIASLSNGTGKNKTITHQSFNLLTSRTRLCKELHAKHDAPWETMLEQVAVLALRELRRGEPIESLIPTEESMPAWFVLNPLLYEKNPTVLYGPGDSMKSFFALYCGLLLASGCCGPNLSVAPTPWKVLFLDWEMSAQDVRGRVKLLQAGDPRLTGIPDYRRCFQPLADEVNELKKIVSEGEYDVLILDSLAMAAGGHELERADSAIRFNAALRSLNCTSLVLGHTPKPHEEQKERHLYGSVFFHNLCRVSWEVRREGETLGLYQKKNNLGPKHEPLGFHLLVTETEAQLTAADLLDEPILNEALPMRTRLKRVLTNEGGLTTKEIAAHLNEKEASVRAMLNRYKKEFVSVEGKWEFIG